MRRRNLLRWPQPREKHPCAKQMCKDVESEIWSAVKDNQSAMQKQDQKINSLVNKLSEIEKYTCNEYDYDKLNEVEGLVGPQEDFGGLYGEAEQEGCEAVSDFWHYNRI